MQQGRQQNVPREERICSKSDSSDIGNEFHYVFDCDHFKNARKKHLRKYFNRSLNAIKFAELFQNKNKQTLRKLALFLKSIMKEM